MPTVLLVLGASLGAVIGAFGNVVIARVPAGQSITRPAPHCPGCGHGVKRHRNIPSVFYLILPCRCANCRSISSIQYLLVVALTSAGFAAAAALSWQRGTLELLPTWWFLVAVGVMLSAIDLRHHRLPDSIVAPSYVAIGLLLAFASLYGDGWWPLGRAAIGGAALLALYALIAAVYPSGMGWGDVKLAGLLGSFTAFVGFPALTVGALASFVLAAPVAMWLVAARSAGSRTRVPFGPFMVAGAMVGVASGAAVSDWYFALLTL